MVLQAQLRHIRARRDLRQIGVVHAPLPGTVRVPPHGLDILIPLRHHQHAGFDRAGIGPPYLIIPGGDRQHAIRVRPIDQAADRAAVHNAGGEIDRPAHGNGLSRGGQLQGDAVLHAIAHTGAGRGIGHGLARDAHVMARHQCPHSERAAADAVHAEPDQRQYQHQHDADYNTTPPIDTALLLAQFAFASLTGARWCTCGHNTLV